MESEFSMESIIKKGFNSKVSDEGDLEVVVEGKVGNIKKAIAEFESIGGI